jgi:Holliday junction resolvase
MGWICVRSAGSLGEVDVVAMANKTPRYPVESWEDLKTVLLIEVKATKAGPFAGFGPKDRADLLRVAERAGGQPMLCWWPYDGKGPRWIGPHRWPPLKPAQKSA